MLLMRRPTEKNMKNALLKCFMMVSLVVSAVGCGGGGGGGAPQYNACGTVGNDPYCKPWYDVMGVSCGTAYPKPGCNFYSDGTKIIDSEDPTFKTGFVLSTGTWQYVDAYGYPQVFTGSAWLAHDGILYDQYGFALNEEGQEQGRDLMGDVASAEKAQVKDAGQHLASRHALAEVTGIKIAETLNDWATLGKKHGRTQRDIEDFSGRLFGVTAAQFTPALAKAQRGDLTGMETLNNDVATHWSTSPETSKEILTGWYSEQIRAFQATASVRR